MSIKNGWVVPGFNALTISAIPLYLEMVNDGQWILFYKHTKRSKAECLYYEGCPYCRGRPNMKTGFSRTKWCSGVRILEVFVSRGSTVILYPYILHGCGPWYSSIIAPFTGFCVSLDCKTVVFFANASDGQYSNERSGASVKRRGRMGRDAGALHTRGSRLQKTSENGCFAV